jgi:hypothetical protein
MNKDLYNQYQANRLNHAVPAQLACWRALNSDQPFALNFDQGWEAG